MSSCLILLLLLSASLVTSGTAKALSNAVPGGNAHNGAKLIARVGCGACHMIPGIDGADGKVGPPLSDVADRIYLAGVVANTPENMIAWLKAPQSFVPGNVMPNLELSDHEARDIAAYLYTLH